MTVLIVDDHESIRKLLLEWLQEEFPACRFYEAQDARSAIRFCWSSLPDLVIMDINMPELNGIEATQYIKNISPSTRVVIVSIHENGKYMEAANEAGASAYVSKGRIYDDLVPTMKELISQAGGL